MHQKIDATDNDELLRELIAYIETLEDEEPYKLTKAERAAVEEGMEDYRQGRVIRNEDFKKEMEEWEKED